MLTQIPGLADIMREILLLNELGGNAAAAYRFIDCDGATGRSGYSFGVCQFDLAHNPAASTILDQVGIPHVDIAALKAQTLDRAAVDRLSAKLKAGAKIIDEWDRKQCRECVDHVLSLPFPYVIPGDLLFHLADYHNQFHMSRDGRCHTWLKERRTPPTGDQFLAWKLTTAWGQKRPDDVRRRFANVQKVLAAHNISRKA